MDELPDPGETFRAHHDELVLAIQRRLEVDRAMAEDAVSLAFLQYAAGKARREHNVGGWLFTTARREALRLLRQDFHLESLDSEHDVPIDVLDETAEAHEALHGLARLTDNQRQALGLFVGGHSYVEICELTGKTYTWVNRHIAEARAVLRRKR